MSICEEDLGSEAETTEEIVTKDIQERRREDAHFLQTGMRH